MLPLRLVLAKKHVKNMQLTVKQGLTDIYCVLKLPIKPYMKN